MDDMASTETSGSRYNPHSNRGRRKQATDPSGKRQLQMREAQRALRARKQEYILDLEQKVSTLTQENVFLKQQVQILSISVPSTSVPCFNQNCAAQIQALQLEILELQTASFMNNKNFATVPVAVSDQMTGTDSEFSGTGSSPSDATQKSVEGINSNALKDPVFDSYSNWIDEIEGTKLKKDKKWPSGEELYGPVDIEPFITRAKSIQSLKDTRVLDRLFNLFVKVSKATDTRTAQSLHLKIIREHLRINDRCPIVDRVLFVEVMSEYHMKYKRHNTHWREICAFDGKKPKLYKTVPEYESPRVTSFRNTLKQIPSFANHHNIIDEMCEFWSSDDRYGPQEFYYMKYLVHTLMIACENAEDHVKFWLAFFIIRQNKRQEMDELIADLEAVSL